MQHGPSMHLAFLKNLASYEVALKDKKQIAEGTYAFTFEKPEGFRFSAGQHVRMTLIDRSETDSEGKSRFLTIASTAGDPDLVFAMRMRDTAFKRVLSSLQIGKKVIIQILLDSPHGSFILHEDTSRPAVFIAGGIGIVPAYAMIKDALQRNLPHKLLLFYSNRRPEDAPFLAELQDLSRQNPAFRLVVTMTEPDQSAQTWRGETGHINRELLEKYVTNFESSIYYVAGLPAMVSAMKTLLTDSGASEESIRAEEFTGFNLNKLQSGDGPRKNHLLYLSLISILVLVIFFHIGAALMVSKYHLSSTILSSPFLYLMLAAMLILIPLKFKHMRSLILKAKSRHNQ